MDYQFTVICGACKCEPGLMSDADGDVAVCPGCGQSDAADEAFRIAAEHHALRTATPERISLTGQTFRWQATRD